MNKFSLLFCVSLFLSGCFHYEPQMFGVPQSIWVTLSEAERVHVIDGYNRKKELEEANRPAREALERTQRLLESQMMINNNNQQKKHKY